MERHTALWTVLDNSEVKKKANCSRYSCNSARKASMKKRKVYSVGEERGGKVVKDRRRVRRK
jgi:hypothetical protein